MAIVVSFAQAVEHRFHYENAAGDTGWTNHHLGKVNHPAGQNPALDSGAQSDFNSRVHDGIYVSEEIYPVAFQIEQDPGHVAGVHFHQADQFQLLLPCDGKFGQRTVDRPIIHFAAACSAYGPLTSGTKVLRYFTLRNGWEPGGLYLPKNRPETFRAGRKPRSVQAVVPHGADHSAESFQKEPIIPLDATGLFATYFKLPAAVDLTTIDQELGRGQYWLVLSGTCLIEGREVGAGSLWFVNPDEPPVTMRGGATGASLVAVQFPQTGAGQASH